MYDDRPGYQPLTNQKLTNTPSKSSKQNLLEKIKVPSHRFLHIVWNERFRSVFATTHHLSLFWAKLIRLRVSPIYILRSIRILSSIRRCPGPCVALCKILIFIPHDRLLLNIFAAAFHTWRQSAPSQTWGRATSWWHCHAITLCVIRNWTFPYHLAYSTGCTCRFRKHVW